MKKNARLAYNALVKIGAPVMEEPWGDGYFRISGEMNGVENGSFGGNPVADEYWADYYDGYRLGDDWDFGVNPEISKILEKYGLYAEWCNPGVLDVYDN